MFQCMTETEQDQQERTLGPLLEDGGADCRHQHQGVYLQPPQPQVVDGFTQQVIAAESIGCDEERQGQPGGRRCDEWQRDAQNQQRSADCRKDQLGFFAENSAVLVTFRVLIMVVCDAMVDVGPVFQMLPDVIQRSLQGGR